MLPVHGNLIINETYIKVCGENGLSIPPSRKGEMLALDAKYLSARSTVLWNSQFFWAIVTWRKHFAHEEDSASKKGLFNAQSFSIRAYKRSLDFPKWL